MPQETDLAAAGGKTPSQEIEPATRPEVSESDPLLTLLDIRAWLQRHIETDVVYGVPDQANSHGWHCEVRIPVRSVRQKLDNLNAAIAAFSCSETGGTR